MQHSTDARTIRKDRHDRAHKEDSPIDYLDVTRLVARAAIDKKAEDLVILDVRGRNSYCDVFVICNGTNTRQVKAIAQGVLGMLKSEAGRLPVGVEGLNSGRWVLADLGEVLVHVFESDLRGYYDLDALWLDAPRISLDDLGLGDLASQMKHSDMPPLTARAR